MAKPSSREQLKQYALRQLGKPVIEINVDDDQLEDRIDEGLQYFQEYHFDGIERMYHIHQITSSKVSVSSTFIEFKKHKDTTGIANNDTTS